ncbi:hypothetical protein FIV00_22215 [Labrenzia sp. THAF82]|uniref:DUF2867 domain-containing protein n=1 Tax=Labrenzia sp. THAF82 TaxID=2587861 RepID=UPI0012686449|nr:DUF2867 domain-containing protein [Labrenzia sp. THAF82]QFT33223.1 hypothetical protein FIV00_22215 [Labrenzia sp. THAF82]
MSIADTLPRDSRLNAYHSKGDYMDTFSVSLRGRPDLRSVDIRVLADHMLNADISWMNKLLSARDAVVKPLGLKTTDDLLKEQSDTPLAEREAGDRVGFFKIYSVGQNEIILGEDDWHQDFRLSIFRSVGEAPRVYATTCCKRHNLFGYAYLALILPFHKKIAATVLDTAIEEDLAA